MRSGYGRGYYGVGQLAPKPPPRGGGSWFKLAVVVGVGAVIWFMWPRRSASAPEYVSGSGGDDPKPVSLSLPAFSALPSLALSPSPSLPAFSASPSLALSAPSEGQPQQLQHDPLDQAAQSRGYASQQAYEDAVVTSARQLQDEGAQVILAPHLQHLAPRLVP